MPLGTAFCFVDLIFSLSSIQDRMKTIFTTDILGAKAFLDAINFSGRISPRIDGGEWIITPDHEFDFTEIKDGNSRLVNHLHMTIGVMDKNEFCARLIEEFGFKQIGKYASYQTPFGFLFHVHWTCA